MKPDLQFEFRVGEDESSLKIARAFAARRQQVWDCYTRSELLDRWFAPKPFTTRTGSMDFREGGHWHYAMIDPSGQEFWGRIDYLTIRPIEHYDAFDGFADATGALDPALPRARWDVDFEDHDDSCVVRTLVRYGSKAELDKVLAMGMEAGMASTLDRLDDLLVVLGDGPA